MQAAELESGMEVAWYRGRRVKGASVQTLGVKNPSKVVRAQVVNVGDGRRSVEVKCEHIEHAFSVHPGELICSWEQYSAARKVRQEAESERVRLSREVVSRREGRWQLVSALLAARGIHVNYSPWSDAAILDIETLERLAGVTT